MSTGEVKLKFDLNCLILKCSAVLILLMNFTIASNAYGIDLDKLNPTLRKEIDSGLKSKIEADIKTDVNSRQKEVEGMFGRQGEVSSFKSKMENVDPGSYNSQGINASYEEHNDVVRESLAHPNMTILDKDDPIFDTYDEITNNLEKYISKDCQQLIGSTNSPSWKELKVRKKVINTEFEKNLCENLQNQYSCRDTLSLTCARREMQWGNWENKEIRFTGWEVYHRNWYYRINWKSRYDGGHFGDGGAHRQSEVRREIASRLGVGIENIDLDIRLPHRGSEPTHFVCDGLKMFSDYLVRYRYRKGTPICTSWKETWEERCTHIAVP